MTLGDVEDYSRRWQANLGAGRFTSIDVDIVTDADGAPMAVGRSVETFQFNSLLVDRRHAERLIREGLMTPAGLEALNGRAGSARRPKIAP